MALREDFLWGGATAANQCEGDTTKVDAVWRTLTLFPSARTEGPSSQGK